MTNDETRKLAELAGLSPQLYQQLTNLPGALSQVNRLADQLASAITGRFDFAVQIDSGNPTVQKLCIMVNFLLETIRRTLSQVEEKNRQVLASERLKSEFFANVSHELRTPLTLMLAPLESLLGGECGAFPPAAGAHLRMVHNNAVRLLQMVTGLLDFSKLEAGKVEVRAEPFLVAAVTRSILEDFRPELDARRLEAEFHCDPADLCVRLDRYLYERILFNLLSNALKFTPGGGRISVELAHHEDLLRLAVSDTGMGISESDQQHLFQRFRQVEGSSTRRFEGTGLGLALIKEFAQLLGGSVAVRSRLGEGTTFTVHMQAPLCPIPASAPGERAFAVKPLRAETAPAAVNADALEDSGLPRILVAEDNPELAMYIATLLQSHGHTRLAANGQEALDAIRQWMPDLVLSDVMMPVKDGLSLCRELKADPATRHIPVVLLTALTHRDALVEGWEAGADEYLFKPLHPRELVTRIRTLLTMIRQRRQAEEERSQLAVERAARSAAEAASQAKDEFLMLVSHELRTPLSAVLGWAQLLRGRHFDAATIEQGLESIERNARAQAQLVGELLDVSRIIAGKIELERKPVDPAAVIGAAIDAIQMAADAKNIRIEKRLDAPAPPVIGDFDRLRQVVTNLLSNAVKFTPETGRIEVCLKNLGAQVQIVVRDNGEGIPPHALPFIFERFRQADSSTTRRHGGLGLGLAIVRHLVELHGGEVSAQSSGRGAGAMLTVTLPASTAVLSEHPAQVPVPPSGASLTGMRVLVVDDDPDTREFLSIVLKNHGAEVTTANNSAEAFGVHQASRPDVLICDLAMPEEDGCSLIRRLRSLQPDQGGAVPAIALSAFADTQARRRALEAGFQMHVPKPINPSDLIALVAELCRSPLART